MYSSVYRITHKFSAHIIIIGTLYYILSPYFALFNYFVLQVSNKRIELFQHPVVWRYLYKKWNTFGFWFYIFQLIMFGAFLAFLSFFVLSVNDPQSEHCKKCHIFRFHIL